MIDNKGRPRIIYRREFSPHAEDEVSNEAIAKDIQTQTVKGYNLVRMKPGHESNDKNLINSHIK